MTEMCRELTARQLSNLDSEEVSERMHGASMNISRMPVAGLGLFIRCLAGVQLLACLTASTAGQIDIQTLDRYFDARPDDDGIGGNMTTRNTNMAIHMITGKNKPEVIAIFVSRDKPQDPDNAPAKWMPFKEWVTVDLGEGDGSRNIFVAAKWKASDERYDGSGWGMTVRRSGPTIWIKEPPPGVISQPIIQIKGVSTCELGGINYDVLDQAGQRTTSDEIGFVTDSFFDEKLFEYTTNWFECLDVELSPGTNTVVVRCLDDAGNVTTTNLVYVFTTAGDLQPPIFISLIWPTPGMIVSGSTFTIRGRIDDVTAQLTGEIASDGRTNHFSGFPERNGVFWYEDVPLMLGENRVTLMAKDAAGNSVKTNFVVLGSAGPELSMDPIAEDDLMKLWEGRITVKGKVTPSGYQVFVNDVRAIVNSDGTWTAENVPVRSPNGGTATFDMTAIPNSAAERVPTPSIDSHYAQASLGTNVITLNADSPACGDFHLHLTDTEERAFVLFSSTNLADWQPILTNMRAAATFDYTDTNAADCRFFRVVPLDAK